MQVGQSKILPQLALGQSQSSILATGYFENEVLKLVDLFVPPMMSSTMSGKAGGGSQNGNKSSAKAPIAAEEKKAGRKEKEDDQKSEKTIQNKESMS